jgi:hypothetical protein
MIPGREGIGEARKRARKFRLRELRASPGPTRPVLIDGAGDENILRL